MQYLTDLFGDIKLIDALGSFAACLTTLAFLPQVFQTWRKGSAHELSLAWLITFFCGILAWLVYGVLLGAGPLIFSNAITLALVGALLMLKMRDLAR
jgi:MtN3 and saliva related transmembrane protein